MYQNIYKKYANGLTNTLTLVNFTPGFLNLKYDLILIQFFFLSRISKRQWQYTENKIDLMLFSVLEVENCI